MNFIMYRLASDTMSKIRTIQMIADLCPRFQSELIANGGVIL